MLAFSLLSHIDYSIDICTLTSLSQIVYCVDTAAHSIHCQVQHWSEGHKLRCAELGAVSAGWKLYNSCTDSAAPAQSTCAICEQGSDAGELLQRGCDCRGAAGVVHLICLAAQASYEDVQQNLRGWTHCRTCTAEFTGKVKACRCCYIKE